MSKAFIKPLDQRKRDDMPDLDYSCEGERGKREGLQHRDDLGHDERSVAIPAIDQDSRKWGQKERRSLAGEADGSEEHGGSGQPVDQPAGSERVIQVPIREMLCPPKKRR